ncbi:hypothetical protein DFH08DRAFT_811249 [Mycena albidolilacea]|uniref:Uncharacterized protein n=1 Tax=Mycena albidolilacea TaxID=1033008 RepID=A0AAD7ENC4_9AGAR|nr:hypothetical protein DFH08DRAFT_811249 [Mycena albidolilacea]
MAAWLDNLKLWIMICGWIFLGARRKHWDNIDSRISKMRFADPSPAQCNSSVDSSNRTPLATKAKRSTGAMAPPACKQLLCRDPRLGAQVVCGANPRNYASDSCYHHVHPRLYIDETPSPPPPAPLARNIAVNLADDPTLYARPLTAVDTSLAPSLTPAPASASAPEMPVLVATLLLHRNEGGAPDWREDEDAVRVEGLEAGLVPELVSGPSTLATFAVVVHIPLLLFCDAELNLGVDAARPRCSFPSDPEARSGMGSCCCPNDCAGGCAAAIAVPLSWQPIAGRLPPEPFHRQAVDIWKSSHECKGRTFLEGTFCDDHVTFDGLPPKIIGRTFVGHHSEMAVYGSLQPKFAMDYGSLRMYGFGLHFPRPLSRLHQKLMGLKGLWVYRRMDYEGFDCRPNAE